MIIPPQGIPVSNPLQESENDTVAWIKIDDHFDEHPKLQQVGPLAWGVWLSGLAYCNRNLTDGFIPWNKAHTLCSFEVIGSDGTLWELCRGSGMSGDNITSQWVVDLLIEAGLWEGVYDDHHGRIVGYRVHDYQDWQRTKDQIVGEREATSKRQSKWRESHNAVNNGESNGVTNAAKNPNKNPKEIRTTSSSVDEGFDDFWSAYPRKVAKQEARRRWQKLNPNADLLRVILDAISRQKRSPDWVKDGGKYIPYPATWLHNGQWEDEVQVARIVQLQSRAAI